MRTKPTTLLQIFCKMILISKVIVKSILDPDDNFCMSINGLTTVRGMYACGALSTQELTVVGLRFCSKSVKSASMERDPSEVVPSLPQASDANGHIAPP